MLDYEAILILYLSLQRELCRRRASVLESCRVPAWIEDSTKDHGAKKPSFIPMLLRVPSRKKSVYHCDRHHCSASFGNTQATSSHDRGQEKGINIDRPIKCQCHYPIGRSFIHARPNPGQERKEELELFRVNVIAEALAASVTDQSIRIQGGMLCSVTMAIYRALGSLYTTEVLASGSHSFESIRSLYKSAVVQR